MTFEDWAGFSFTILGVVVLMLIGHSCRIDHEYRMKMLERGCPTSQQQGDKK